MSNLDYRKLFAARPDSAVAHMMETLSEADFAAVIAGLGGREIKFPRPERLCEGHKLVLAVGLDLATQLCQMFAQEAVSIPLGGRKPDERHGVIIKMLEDGVSRGDIAAHLGVTQRHVRRMIARIGHGDKQTTVKGEAPATVKMPAIAPDTSLVKRIEHCIRLVLSREINNYDAVEALGINMATFRKYREEFEQTGALKSLADKAMASPANSNAVLTGRAGSAGAKARSASESRASGL